MKSTKQFDGNIGYGIRPTERRKGYNKINLYLGLIEALKENKSVIKKRTLSRERELSVSQTKNWFRKS